MATIHINPQHKGGIGKTWQAFLLAQSLIEAGQEPVCIDTDPLNQTFAAFKRFNAEWINICDDHNRFDESRFDRLMEVLLGGGDDDCFVIDCGTSTFVPLCSYMAESNGLPFLVGHGHSVYLHSVIAGGDLLLETVRGLDNVLGYFSDIPVCVWLNGFFGPIGAKPHGFEDMAIYQANQERIKALIHIPELNPQTFGKDMKKMSENSLTFSEAIHSDDFSLMSKQRLKMAWRDISSQLSVVQF